MKLVRIKAGDDIAYGVHDLEDAIHDLDDYAFSSEPVYGGPVYSSPVIHTRPASGITIGGRGFSFTIGR